MSRHHPFGRYAPLIDDWPAFEAAINRPLPTTLWANPPRLDRDALARLLASEGVNHEPLAWQPMALRVDAGFAPGRHWGYFAGLFQTQEEVAMLPVALMDLRPGERILDLCAAPGNKTAQIATALGGTGTVVANELKRGRLSALRQTIKRLGLTNVVLTSQPAQEYPLRAGPFDRVLVDAPCSGEGTIRKNPRVATSADAEAREHLALQQRRMLTRALQLVRPGGRVVYATCTFAPEENECVVNDVLAEFDGSCRLLPATVPGFKTTPGVTAWAGRALDGSLAGSLRVWPHQNDSGGFFVAVLERTEGGSTAGETLALEGAPAADLDGLDAWFGLPDGWREGLQLVRWGGRYRNLISDDANVPARPPLQYCGLPTLGVQVRPPKLTTAAALRFGDRAQRRFVELAAPQATSFLRREPCPVGQDQMQALGGIEEGHVLVRYCGHTLGVGDLRQQAGQWLIASLFPKAWTALAGSPTDGRSGAALPDAG